MILGGGEAAHTGRTRRWVMFTLVVSILALVGGLIIVLLLSQFYIVPHLQSDDFVQTHCYVRSIEILHIKREGQVSKFSNPNCTDPKVSKDAPKPKPNYDDFDFTLSGTTSHPPGFYPTKPSGIFTRNYDNRRTFPNREGRSNRAKPSNIYRTNSWNPFQNGYSQPLVHQPQAQVQEKVLSPQMKAQLQEAHPHLPKALAQHATISSPGDHLEEDDDEEDENYIPGLPKALAQYAEAPIYTSRGHKKRSQRHRRHSRRSAALAPDPGVHALVPAPAAPSPSMKAQPLQRASRDCSTGYVQAGTLCVHVSVLFRGLDGFVALGTLYADQKSLPRENHTSEFWPTKKCICDGCTITALSGNGSAVDEILVGTTKIKQGSRTRCYYPMTGGGHLLMFRRSNAVALHAILWPTLVFVSGFVGLFFSCLIMQKQRQQRRKQQTRPPMAYV